MARRVVRARVEAELRRPWLRCADAGAGGYLRGPAVVREARRRVWDAPLPEGVPLPEIPDESGRGRWKLDNHRQEIEFGDDPDYLEWDVAPADAPAQDSYDVPDGERGVRRRTVYYDPAVTQVTRGDIAKQEIRHNVSAQQNSITDFDLPAGMIWRGMSHEEWEAAKANGYIESNGSYNLGDENSYQRGRTYFSTRPESAALYATGYAPWQFQPSFSRPGHVVAIPDRPDVARGALGEGSADQSEVGVPGRIPFDQVAQHYVARPFAIFPGRAWTQKGWDGWESRAGGSSGMYRWSPEHPVRTAGRRTAGEGDWHSRAGRDDEGSRRTADREWFHVSPHQLPVGTVLKPGGGESPYGKGFYKRKDRAGLAGYVWMEPYSDSAQSWSGRYLYRVEPDGEPELAGGYGWRAPGARVVEQLQRTRPWVTKARRRQAAIRFEVNPALGLDDDQLGERGSVGNWAYAIDDEPSEDASGRPLGAGEPVAELCWDPHSGEVNWVQTRKNRRRQGIGRGLFNWVRENHQPDLRHSDDLSDDGRAFAEAVAALRTARALLRDCGGRR